MRPAESPRGGLGAMLQPPHIDEHYIVQLIVKRVEKVGGTDRRVTDMLNLNVTRESLNDALALAETYLRATRKPT